MRSGRFQHLRFSLPSDLESSTVAPGDEGAEAFVTKAEIRQAWLMPNASNYTFLVELCQGDERGYGVYKPQAGEAPLWDFPSGTLYRRERATYVMSRLLGWDLVPPTVEREGEMGVGSLQLYVPPVKQSNYFNLLEDHADDALRMAVFDLVVNNADRKAGHCFVAQAGGVWGIDHGLTFNMAPKLRTVIWDFAGQRVPRSLLADLRRLAGEMAVKGAALAALGEWLIPQEVAATQQRIKALLADPVMPHPRSRRDVPWPWI